MSGNSITAHYANGQGPSPLHRIEAAVICFDSTLAGKERDAAEAQKGVARATGITERRHGVSDGAE
jgi:hypothetical protein